MDSVYVSENSNVSESVNAPENSNVSDNNVHFASKDGKYLCSVERKCVCYLPGLLAIAENKNFKQVFHNEKFIEISESKEVLETLATFLKTGSVEMIKDEDLPEFMSKLEMFGGQAPVCERIEDTEFARIQLKEMWQRRFTKDDPKVDKVLLFDVIDTIPLIKPPYSNDIAVYSTIKKFTIKSTILESVKDRKRVKFYIDNVDLSEFGGKVVLAGGSLVSILLCRPVNDYDLFFVGCTEEEATQIIQKIMQTLAEDAICMSVISTKNCWTIEVRKNGGGIIKRIQFIFRLYKNIDEIMLGFDIDSCCMVYDGKEIYMSKRCLFAFQNHVNIIDFTRMSPTYEYRLYKYSLRGFDVHVPGFEYKSVNPNFKYIPNGHLKMNINRTTGVLTILRPKIKNSHKKKRRVFPYRIVNGGNTNSNVNNNNNNNNNNNIFNDNNTNGDAGRPLKANEKELKTFRKYEIITKLSGLDILLFLSHGLNAGQKIKISDYDEYINDDTSPKVYQFSEESGFDGIVLDGKWIKTQRTRQDDFIFERLMKLLENRELLPIWITENPGDQITSSMHAFDIKNRDTWYNGTYYSLKKDNGLEPETTSFGYNSIRL
jgi:hypothetical protein